MKMVNLLSTLMLLFLKKIGNVLLEESELIFNYILEIMNILSKMLLKITGFHLNVIVFLLTMTLHLFQIPAKLNNQSHLKLDSEAHYHFQLLQIVILILYQLMELTLMLPIML